MGLKESTKLLMIINLVSYNLWADSYLQPERLTWFIDRVLRGKPDILFLQGVSKETIVELARVFKELGYNFITNTMDKPVFEVIATHWKIGDWKFNKFSTSKINTGLLWGYIELAGEKIAIATAELDEDKNNVGQLNCALKFLSDKFGHAIMACDTHIKGKYSFPDWNDAWITTGENGFCEFTLDYTRNNNLYEKVQMRSNRIFYKGNMTPIGFNLIATEKSCGKIKKVNPSRGFGINISLLL